MTSDRVLDRPPAAEPSRHDVRPDEPPHRSVFREHRRKLAIGGIVLLFLVAAGVWAFFHYSGRESTDDARIDGHIANVSARVGGHITQINFDENERVQAGAVLVQIDPTDYKVALDRAQAELRAAESNVRAAQSNIPVAVANTQSQLAAAQAGAEAARAAHSGARSDIEAAHARVAAAEAAHRQAVANYDRAAKDLERYRQLAEKDEIPRQQYDAAVTAAAAALAAVDSAKANVAQAEEVVRVAQSRAAQAGAQVTEAATAIQAARAGPQQVVATQAQAGAAEAGVAQRRAAVEQARLNLEYTTLRAPVAGLVGRRNVEIGQNVQPGQPLFSIVPVEDVWVTANFKETQLANMRPGQRAIVRVDAYGGREYTAHVESIGAATGGTFSILPAENASGNYVKVVQRVPVKIVLEKGQDPERLLRPGMSVEPTVFTK